MTAIGEELRASYAFMERNFFLTRRTWAWEVAFLVYSVASALSISFIGVDQGSNRLVLSLMIGAIFWNYLSVVFSWIAETIAVERWEGTLEYTMMAPIRRSSRLIGQVAYAMVYGLIHTAVIFVVLLLFFPQLDLSKANPGTTVVFMALATARADWPDSITRRTASSRPRTVSGALSWMFIRVSFVGGLGVWRLPDSPRRLG